MPVTEYLLVDPDEPYDWGAAFREIGRNVQEGLDAIWAFLHSVVQFLMQLPELIINALGDIDFDKVKQDVDNGVHQGIQFLIEHERLVAAAFFVLSLILGFPIGFIMSIIFFIPQLIFLGILRCIGFRRKGVERDSLAASYQSRNYGAYTPSNSQFAAYQSRAAVGPIPRGIGNIWMMLFSWLSMITSIVLFVHSFCHPQQILN
ncbi:hypothetical protein JOM56_009323 [Amanita muscaria]